MEECMIFVESHVGMHLTNNQQNLLEVSYCYTAKIDNIPFLAPCLLPDCSQPCYVDPRTGTSETFCGQSHTDQAYKQSKLCIYIYT